MNKIYKTILSVSAAAIVAGATLAAPAMVFAQGDSNLGRPVYTIEQINAGDLGDKIVFNSISNDPVLGDERNFVSARLTSDTTIYHDNTMSVKDGDVVTVRLYVHNNSPKGRDGVAEGVKAEFSLPTNVAKSQVIVGYLDATNADPVRVFDEVELTSDENFYLEYVEGSANYRNKSESGEIRNFAISDNVVADGGTMLGYDAMDGKIPGCYGYSGELTIQLKVHKSVTAKLAKTVRIKGSGNDFTESVEANIGDEVEFQIEYQNLLDEKAENVMIRDILPTNMEYVDGTTKLYNSFYQDGVVLQDNTVTTSGINIGDYMPKGNAYVRFTAKVVDKTLGCGKNQLVNWANSTAKAYVSKDDASVLVAKTCDNLPPVVDNPSELPSTGAESVLGVALGAGAVTTAAGYFIASRKKLM